MNWATLAGAFEVVSHDPTKPGVMNFVKGGVLSGSPYYNPVVPSLDLLPLFWAERNLCREGISIWILERESFSKIGGIAKVIGIRGRQWQSHDSPCYAAPCIKCWGISSTKESNTDQRYRGIRVVPTCFAHYGHVGAITVTEALFGGLIGTNGGIRSFTHLAPLERSKRSVGDQEYHPSRLDDKRGIVMPITLCFA